MTAVEKLAMCVRRRRNVKPSGALRSKLGPLTKKAGRAEILTGKDWEDRKKKMTYKGVGPEWLGLGRYKDKGKKKPMKKVAEAFIDELSKLPVDVLPVSR